MTTARRLQEIREQQQVRRRATRLWDAALSGRSALPIPLGLSRVKGGVQQPSIGTVSERGETAVFHHPGLVTVSAADPRPVIFGGLPRFTIHARIAPTTSITLRAYRSGIAVGSAFVMTGTDWVEDVEVQYDPGDTVHLATTSIGAGGAAGLVAVCEFRVMLDP